MRLFSQLAQDSELKVGKVLWVAGHSGPETAEDSRTHFGIFETGVTQLFPEGHVIDLHPWEYNEVPVVLGAALRHRRPIVALHLTRPPIEIPDRAALGMPSHFEAARGAYVHAAVPRRPPRMGTVFVRGTIPTANLVSVLPELDGRGLNVKVVAAISPQLFALQDAAYREATVSAADRWDAMAVTNGAFKLMRDWVDGPLAAEYSLSRRLGRPLAHRRHGRRGDGRGAPRSPGTSSPRSSGSRPSVTRDGQRCAPSPTPSDPACLPGPECWGSGVSSYCARSLGAAPSRPPPRPCRSRRRRSRNSSGSSSRSRAPKLLQPFGRMVA